MSFSCQPSPQAQFKDVSDADLKAMDVQISELSAQVQSLTQSCRQLDAGSVSVTSRLKMEIEQKENNVWVGAGIL